MQKSGFERSAESNAATLDALSSKKDEEVREMETKLEIERADLNEQQRAAQHELTIKYVNEREALRDKYSSRLAIYTKMQEFNKQNIVAVEEILGLMKHAEPECEVVGLISEQILVADENAWVNAEMERSAERVARSNAELAAMQRETRINEEIAAVQRFARSAEI
jgi:hypothetical protein